MGCGFEGCVSRKKVAVKTLHWMIITQRNLERLEREMCLMAQVRHPNVIRIIAAVFDDEARQLQAPPMIVLELFDMNLRQCYEHNILQNTNQIPEIAYGLHYLHNRQEPIIHRDMTAEGQNCRFGFR